jgi:L-erythro-3,5-diaminohexanoate dehydrogenase
MKQGTIYGTHRVLEPLGVLPQAALKLDNTMEIYDNELLISVNTLNIDSASFTQLKRISNKDPKMIEEMILDIVASRGKMQNPETGSGGMLIGTVKQVGPNFPDQNLKVGDKIATLVSLTLTPLKIKKIHHINITNEQVSLDAEAILFASGIYAKLPSDLPEKLALAALDVAGAPAQVKKLVKPGDQVIIIGAAGKSGVLCCYQAMKNVGESGKVIGIVRSREQKDFLLRLKLVHDVIVHDATDAYGLYLELMKMNNGSQADVTINCVSTPNTENSSILLTKNSGIVYFFSMATSFTKAALGAEGIGSDVTMIIGNGYTKGHADLTLDLVRESDIIRQLFLEKYV